MRRLFCFIVVSTLWLQSVAGGQQPLPPPPSDDVLLGDPYVRIDLEEVEVELARFKKQALQSVSLTAGGLFDTGDGDLSSSFLEASIGSGIPLGSLDNILGVTPRARIDWIDAAPSIDIPSELYQFEVQFFYRSVLNERLSTIFVFSPSIRSDLKTSDRAFRIFALGLLNWQYIPDRLTLSGGAVVLGRADLPVLPAVGLIWTPRRTVKLDLRFPRSTLFYRLAKDGRRSELWTYSCVGLGGNTWAVTRRSGETDELSTRDIRLMVGIEKRLDGGGGWFVEAGYALDRRLEYERADSQRKLSNAALLTAGWRY
ncbi:DUF6268 family outer membrane beta-barrel protein [Roseimaritima ulvae]|uniref:DUF6268 domain-containing protein n=1 Tax=Roseimaritima ulvae TaxID=980254 RepID=A0A5B9R9U7_9BACT|nr:DUF6268 family outer membrane beta-barrel protein [Roseimaritima ulvae]QEG43811.1 hypothetical protein UC8_58680 [Roseimaritima ulvae]